MSVRSHVADTTTDDQGRFSVDVGLYSGLLLVTATGGSFVDLSTGATIQLDATNGLESIAPLDLIEMRDDALVSPIGHLIAARTRWRAALVPDVEYPVRRAEQEASEHLNRHFGNVDWTRQKLGSLEVVAISPTEPVRAALVQAALSELAHDIASAAGASPQEVNVLALTQQLAADLGDGMFDGNDHDNASDFAQGLQLGVCGPVANCPPVPPGACAVGACRPLCDLYAGTPRALLAGEMIKVIGSSLNQTRLDAADIVAVARAMADNADSELFDACVENLDRTPPKLEWIAPTPGAMTYVRGVVSIKARAIDNTDPMPRVWIDDQPPAPSSAEAAIDTMDTNGPLVVRATAKDMAGNVATISLPDVIADNLAPVLTLASDGYFVEGATWWTTSDTPPLEGTVSDASPVTVTAATLAGAVDATVTGTTWTGSLAGANDLPGAEVTVVATDAAGNRTQLRQRIRTDVTPPRLTFQPSVVSDEAQEPVEFLADEVPRHTHGGTAIDLAAAGSCPPVTKFSYLLGANPPVFGLELDGQNNPRRNPLHYVVITADDGVGVAAGSTHYRVGLRQGNTTSWMLDWTPAGTPTVIAPGVDQYDVGLFSNLLPALATTEGVYQVEFRTTDRLGRTSTAARCFDLHLRAPPLHFVDTTAPHAYQLQSLSLSTGSFRDVAARLLDSNATGASVIDKDVTNGTAETVYLEVAVAGPASVTLSQRFVLANFSDAPQGTELSCLVETGGDPANCHPPRGGPRFESPSLNTTTATTLDFPAKVFELDSTGAPTTEIPCFICGMQEPGTARRLWRFTIPPRLGSGAPRRIKVMTMIGQVSGLWPQDSAHPASPPFADTSLGGRLFTGAISVANVGCSTIFRGPDGTPETCLATRRVTPYRALKEVHIDSSEQVSAAYRTAATPQLQPAPATSELILPRFSWTTAPITLP